MEWMQQYPKEKQPTAKQVEVYIGNPLWQQFNKTLQEAYKVAPAFS